MKKIEQGEIIIEKMSVGNMSVWIKGESPLIYNAMSNKAWHELLLPKGRKTMADKAQTLKHDPIEEYRNSVYSRIGKGETRLTFPASAFKAAMCNAALEIPGAKKTQIGRLVWVCGDVVDVYGVPQLYMAIVRSADMNRTPDVRTRAILSTWCCCVTIRFVLPTMTDTAVGRLLETAGLVIGIGDYRQEKGKGNYGQFKVTDKADVEKIIKSGGLNAQDEALKNPVCYDRETNELLAWYQEERKKRGR